MAEKKSIGKELTKGFIIENPVLRLVLGTCPTLATTTSVSSAIGMGVSASIVLICSNIVISALRKVIPQKVRIPAYIVIIASFVTIVQMLVKAFVPVLNEQLGVYLPLIVVNCIILGRAEAFASKHTVFESAIDGIGMGVGYIFALFVLGTIREVLGNGSFFGIPLFGDSFEPVAMIAQAPGAFIILGCLIALMNHIVSKSANKEAA